MLARSILLFLARQRAIRNGLEALPFSKRLTGRFVAGETLGEAVAVCRKLEAQGLLATLDHLGENVTTEAEAEQSLAAYLEALGELEKAKVGGTTSLKLTQFGLDLSTEVCLRLVGTLASEAKRSGRRIEIDMESSEYTDRTFAVAEEIQAQYGNVRAVVQAYLYRSEQDIERLCRLGLPVRLCKGAYLEPEEKAFPDKAAVDENYRKLTRKLLMDGVEPAIASHDEAMVDYALQVIRERGLGREAYEFQMLYGVRRDLQQKLVREGHRVRLYIPYGREWYPYFMRRLAERPANVGFLLRNLFRD
jgi:proline dehydrogenase